MGKLKYTSPAFVLNSLLLTKTKNALNWASTCYRSFVDVCPISVCFCPRSDQNVSLVFELFCFGRKCSVSALFK